MRSLLTTIVLTLFYSMALSWPLEGLYLGSGPSCENITLNDGDGSAITFWRAAVSTYPGIRTQHVTADGRIIWDEGGKFLGHGALLNPVPDQEGGAILIWSEAYDNGGSEAHRIVARRINFSGNNVWNNNVTISTPGPSMFLHVCSDGKGGAYIVWSANQTPANSLYCLIYMQHIDKNGNLWSSNFLLEGKSGHVNPIPYPNLALDRDGSVICAWTKVVDITPYTYIAKVSNNTTNNCGYYSWTPTYLGPYPLGYLSIGIASTSTQSNAYLFTCANNTINTYYINCTNGSSTLLPFKPLVDSISLIKPYSDISGHLYFSYQTSNKIKCAMYDLSATLYGPINVCDYNCNQTDPSLIVDLDNNCYLVWQDTRYSTASTAIYGQKIKFQNNTLSRLWNANGVEVCCPQPLGRACFSQAPKNNGGFYVSWRDNKIDNVTEQIYQQAINTDGSKPASENLSWDNTMGDFTGTDDYHYWAFAQVDSSTPFPPISWLSSYQGSQGVLKIDFTGAPQGVKLTSFSRFTATSDWYKMKVRFRMDGNSNYFSIQPIIMLYDSVNSYDIKELGATWTGYGLVGSGSWYEFSTYVNRNSLVSGQLQLIIKNDNSSSNGEFYIDTIDLSATTPNAISSTAQTYTIPSNTSNWGFESVSGYSLPNYTNDPYYGCLRFNFSQNQAIKFTSLATYNVPSGRNAVLRFEYYIPGSDGLYMDCNRYLYSSTNFPFDIGANCSIGMTPGSWKTVYVPLTVISGNTTFQPQIILQDINPSSKTVYIRNIQLIYSSN